MRERVEEENSFSGRVCRCNSVFALPITITITVNAISWLAVFLIFYFGSVYQVYRMTIRNIKLEYSMLNPEGHPDINSGRMPRPIYEDMEQCPWFFRKKRKKVANETRRIRKKQRVGAWQNWVVRFDLFRNPF